MWFQVKFLYSAGREVLTRNANVFLEGEYTEDDAEDDIVKKLQSTIAREKNILTQDVKIISFKLL